MLLHKHNQETYAKMTELLLTENRVCCVQPTGTGKSFLILQLISDNPDSKFLLCSPSNYIFSQIKTHADNNNISLENCSYITYSKLYQTELSEIENLEAEYIVLDEFHRLGSPDWGGGAEKLLSSHINAKVIGTSATPIRYLDSMRNMAEELFQNNYAVNMTLAEAIYRKILPLPVYVTSFYQFSGEIARLEKRAEMSDNPRLKMILLGKIQKAKTMIADLDCGIETIFVRHIKNRNGKFIMFCSDVEHLNTAYENCADWLSGVNKNIRIYYVYSRDSDAKQNYENFCNDNDASALKILLCVDMLNEGVHIQGIDGVIMLRATQSANVFYQQLGRALACSESCKKPVIFDLVNNYETGDTASQYAKIMEIGRNYGENSDDEIEFELYDYVRDIREILNELHNSFETSWEIVYEILCEFKEKFSRFPFYEESYEGLHIGIWCSNQRILYKKNQLEKSKIDKLDAIDFVWNTDDERWLVNFRAIKKFKLQKGHLPTRSELYANENTINLYTWMVTQRQRFSKGDLPEKYQQMLLEIGFDLNPETKDERWKRLYEEAKRFYTQNQRFPNTSDVKDRPQVGELYRWLIRQRKLYQQGNLKEEKIELLEQIHMIWNTADEVWNEQFEVLREYVSEHGRRPAASEKYHGKSIGQWYIKQMKRLRNGEMDEEKSRKLMPFALQSMNLIEENNRNIWERNFTLLQSFIEENHRFPFSKEKYQGIELYAWLRKQKLLGQQGRLSQELIDQFASVHIDILHFSSSKEMPQ